MGECQGGHREKEPGREFHPAAAWVHPGTAGGKHFLSRPHPNLAKVHVVKALRIPLADCVSFVLKEESKISHQTYVVKKSDLAIHQDAPEEDTPAQVMGVVRCVHASQ